MTRRILTCAAAALALGIVLDAQTADRPQSETQALRVNERIRALQAEADKLAGEARSLLGDLRRLEVERQLQTERVAEARAAVVDAEAAIAAANGRLDALEQQRAGQLPDLKAQLVDIYKRGRTGYARLLFGSAGVREFSRATRAVAALMRINAQRVAEHRRTLDEVQRQRALLEGELRVRRGHEADARQAETAADRAVAARAALVAQIDARRDLNAQLAGELQVAYERLQQQITAVAAGRPADAVAVPLAPFRGALDWPVVGRVAAAFGQNAGRPGDTVRRSGIEIAASEGSAVQAIHPGLVTYAEPFAGFGNLVILDHGANTLSLYGYLSSITVARGTAVDSGTELGRVGTPPSGNPALYLEIRVDGRSVDPVQWLKAR